MTASNYLSSIVDNPIETINSILTTRCGINNFFANKSDLYCCLSDRTAEEQNEYGDWQTNLNLAIAICKKLKHDGIDPEVIIEPTCGKGNFIIAALMVFDNIREIYGIEIYKPYVNEVKYQILQFYLNHTKEEKPEFHIYHDNFFDFDLTELKTRITGKNILILGNPPWVTNSKLSERNSTNLPVKSNFKNHRGLESITGKGNFDISEYITIQLIKVFQQENAKIALLLKSSVIKNIVYEQGRMKYPITSISQYRIDAKKEFNVSVDAALFYTIFNKGQYSQICNTYDFYTNSPTCTYGWVGNHFVSDIERYGKSKNIEGVSQLTWRSGIKHDCAKVMELDFIDNQLYNGYNEPVNIESDILYPLIKSSDLQSEAQSAHRTKYVIITQKHTSEDTASLKLKFPLAYSYLESHADKLCKRGSRIYRSRPRFCIFGVGKYSFMKYKVAISGLYKEPKFQLVSPKADKIVMVDDTCYAIGFDDEKNAAITCEVLNHEIVQIFIKSIMFHDAKRSITKELLMRIDIAEAARLIGPVALGLAEKDFEEYINFIKGVNNIDQGYLFKL